MVKKTGKAFPEFRETSESWAGLVAHVHEREEAYLTQTEIDTLWALNGGKSRIFPQDFALVMSGRVKYPVYLAGTSETCDELFWFKSPGASRYRRHTKEDREKLKAMWAETRAEYPQFFKK